MTPAPDIAFDSDIRSDLQSVNDRLQRVEARCRVSADPRVRRSATTVEFLRTRVGSLIRTLDRIGRRHGAVAAAPDSAPGPSGRVQPLVTLGPGGDFRQQLVPDGAGHIDVIG